MVCDPRHEVTGLSTNPIIVPVLPTLLQDAIDTADKWDNSNRIEPFTDIYYVGLVHQRKFIRIR